jgi:hypothetical protein
MSYSLALSELFTVFVYQTTKTVKNSHAQIRVHFSAAKMCQAYFTFSYPGNLLAFSLALDLPEKSGMQLLGS